MTIAYAKPDRVVVLAALLLGFSFGGFFDGILFHQILQWHHLLSRVDSVADNLRVQIMADGLFHAAMYAVAAAGLALVLARRSIENTPDGRGFAAWFLIGFGAWQIVDVVAMHWIAGLHNLRIGPTWLFWDFVALLVGVIFCAAGWAVTRRTFGLGRGSGAIAPLLAAATLVSGVGAAMPTSQETTAAIVFPKGTTAAQALEALAQVDARSILSNRVGDTWVVAVSDWRKAVALYGQGATFVAAGPVARSCFSGLSQSP